MSLLWVRRDLLPYFHRGSFPLVQFKFLSRCQSHFLINGKMLVSLFFLSTEFLTTGTHILYRRAGIIHTKAWWKIRKKKEKFSLSCYLAQNYSGRNTTISQQGDVPSPLWVDEDVCRRVSTLLGGHGQVRWVGGGKPFWPNVLSPKKLKTKQSTMPLNISLFFVDGI